MRRSLKAFMDHPDVSVVQAVIHPNHHELYDAAVQGLALPVPVDGGATRQGSVLNGLESLNADEPSTVLIHDAARPLVDPGVISRVLAALQTSPGAIPALAVADTLAAGTGAGDYSNFPFQPRKSFWHRPAPVTSLDSRLLQFNET